MVDSRFRRTVLSWIFRGEGNTASPSSVYPLDALRQEGLQPLPGGLGADEGRGMSHDQKTKDDMLMNKDSRSRRRNDHRIDRREASRAIAMAQSRLLTASWHR